MSVTVFVEVGFRCATYMCSLSLHLFFGGVTAANGEVLSVHTTLLFVAIISRDGLAAGTLLLVYHVVVLIVKLD